VLFCLKPETAPKSRVMLCSLIRFNYMRAQRRLGAPSYEMRVRGKTLKRKRESNKLQRGEKESWVKRINLCIANFYIIIKVDYLLNAALRVNFSRVYVRKDRSRLRIRPAASVCIARLCWLTSDRWYITYCRSRWCSVPSIGYVFHSQSRRPN